MTDLTEVYKGKVIEVSVTDRLLADGRRIIKSAEPSAQAAARIAARIAGAARRASGPSATLNGLQLGQVHVFTQYVARSQIATQLGRIKAEFVCTTVAEGLRVERTK